MTGKLPGVSSPAAAYVHDLAAAWVFVFRMRDTAGEATRQSLPRVKRSDGQGPSDARKTTFVNKARLCL